MCARLEFMFQGHFVRIVVGPGGAHVAANTANLVDVRNRFGGDYELNVKKINQDLTTLRAAVQDVWSALDNGGSPLRVQCEEGRSRSARVVGAFLITYCGDTAENAMRKLREAFAGPRDGCNQQLHDNRVWEWLDAYGRSPIRLPGT